MNINPKKTAFTIIVRKWPLCGWLTQEIHYKVLTKTGGQFYAFSSSVQSLYTTESKAPNVKSQHIFKRIHPNLLGKRLAHIYIVITILPANGVKRANRYSSCDTGKKKNTIRITFADWS